MHEEGWYQDPYKFHQDRWFSGGTPTALVRDGDTESHDVPPSEPPPQPLVRTEPPTFGGDGEDLQRADSAEPRDLTSRMTDAVLGSIGQTIPPH